MASISVMAKKAHQEQLFGANGSDRHTAVLNLYRIPLQIKRVCICFYFVTLIWAPVLKTIKDETENVFQFVETIINYINFKDGFGPFFAFWDWFWTLDEQVQFKKLMTMEENDSLIIITLPKQVFESPLNHMKSILPILCVLFIAAKYICKPWIYYKKVTKTR